MSVTDQEIVQDQLHFDDAWTERERTRESLGKAGLAAAGPISGAAAIARRGKAMADSLAPASEAVAFGRFDDDAEGIYIGKNHILSQDKDVLVVSWKAHAAEPYYNATIANPLGVTRRRTFATKNNRILSYQDTVFRELAARVESLTEPQRLDIDDALLADLELSRSAEMRDIVQTIHASQYHLIERPLQELLIVQGGPGTGKTAVALHRVSWLLYNESELESDEVLVVGPNKAFIQYIRTVLPALGDTAVLHTALTGLGPLRSSGRIEHRETSGLKGQVRMAGLLSRALRNRVRAPTAPVEINTTSGPRFLAPGGIADGIRKLGAVPYASGRNSLRQLLESAVLATPSRPVANPRSLDAVIDRIWPTMTPGRFLQELLGSRDRLIAAAGDEFTAGDIDRLHRAAASNLGTEEWSDADVALLDEADWLINGSSRGVGHIVVDEAQDLSPMQLRSLARRSANGSYTLSGDIAQSTGLWARDTWDDVVSALTVAGTPVRIENLQYGYRVPREVYDLARPLLSTIAPDLEPPTVVRSAPRPPDLQWAETDDVIGCAVARAQEHAGKGRFVGVIAPDGLVSFVSDAFKEAEIHAKLVSSGELGQSINLLTAAESKGLEFDAVVVMEPAAISREGHHGLRNLYIALTRTTKFLSVVYSEALPDIGLEHGRAEIGVVPEPIPRSVDTAAEAPVIGPAELRPTSVGSGRIVARSALSPRQRKIVDDYAEGLASEIRDSVAKTTFVALLEEVAARLGLASPTWAVEAEEGHSSAHGANRPSVSGEGQ